MAPVEIAIKEIQFFVRNLRTRMPFRFGTATVLAAPILHVAMEVELASGFRATGYAADVLPPKWFDKDPDRSYAENLADLMWGARRGAAIYGAIAATPGVVFEIWRCGYHAMLQWADEHGLNHLTAGQGSSLMERALIDGLGNAIGMSYYRMLADNVLGIELGALHAQLQNVEPAQVIAPKPLADVFVRHCVGLADPILVSDIENEDRVDDGLPQALEEYLSSQAISYLKIKVCGDQEADIERLRRIAGLLSGLTRRYYISLDGNEQYADVGSLIQMLERMTADPELKVFYENVIFIEQPFDRKRALDPSLADSFAKIPSNKPLIIDESDDDLFTFLQAVEVGYKGVSTKICKGLIKAIANQALAQRLGAGYFLTAEDLMNVPVVPLHQDMVHLAALGISHAERNGHHYVHGLDHLSLAEKEFCHQRHGSMYGKVNGGLALNVTAGRVNLRSLQTSGLGVADGVDLKSMVPLEEWSFESLG